MKTQFRIDCPECSAPMLVEGNWDDPDYSVGMGPVAYIEQAVVKCGECEHEMSDREREYAEGCIERHPKEYDPYYLEGFGE